MNDEAPGWDAIDAACKKIHGKRKPYHVGTIISFIFGGRDPLHGISAYRCKRPRHYWHFVTYGYSELWEKESDDPAVSGYGIEMTFRLACKATDKKPPNWAFSFLQNLARYVFATGNVFAAGHYLDCNGPIAQGKKTAIRAVLFALDPQMGAIDTPNGKVAFIQTVGVTLDELEATQEWSTLGFLKLLGADDPLMITDLKRASLRQQPAKDRAITAAMRREGSNCSVLYADVCRWQQSADRLAVTVGAKIVPALARLLRGRTLHQREFQLCSSKAVIKVQPAKRAGWRLQGDTLVLKVTPALAEAMQASLTPKRGRNQWEALPGFTLKVVPTKIKDQDGKVVEVIG